jgi:CTP-dependent riboflavin kinase
MERQTITGVLATGLGEATGFTSLDWARQAFRDHLGIDVFPGTVNVMVTSDEARAAWRLVKTWPGIVLPPPRPDWCNSRCYHARINDRIDAAVVLPEIDSYPEDQIELIASVGVRDTLGLQDGDRVSIDIRAV